MEGVKNRDWPLPGFSLYFPLLFSLSLLPSYPQVLIDINPSRMCALFISDSSSTKNAKLEDDMMSFSLFIHPPFPGIDGTWLRG